MNNTIFINSATTSDTNVVLIPSREIKTLVNATTYRIIIACNVEATANLPIYIQTALGDIPVLCKYANTLYSSQLRKRTMYCIGYGNGNDNYELGQFIIQSNVCPRGEVAPTTTPTPTNKK